jgi:uncharacterized membrane protein (UPF0127 family)
MGQKSSKTWSADVVIDPETNEYIINFPDEMVKEMGWEVGDTLDWHMDGDTIVLKKVE